LWRADRAAAIAYNRRDVEIEIEIARITAERNRRLRQRDAERVTTETPPTSRERHQIR
jgi:hypothetical protein